MLIPDLPTDNLYKFVAVSGTIIALVVPYLIIVRITNAYKTMRRLKLRMALLLLEVRRLDKRVDKVIKEFEEIPEGMRQLAHMLEDRTTILSHRTETLREFVKDIGWLCAAGYIVSMIGLQMARFGYCYWYYRLQQYQDIVISLQVRPLQVVAHTPTVSTQGMAGQNINNVGFTLSMIGVLIIANYGMPKQLFGISVEPDTILADGIKVADNGNAARRKKSCNRIMSHLGLAFVIIGPFIQLFSVLI